MDATNMTSPLTIPEIEAIREINERNPINHSTVLEYVCATALSALRELEQVKARVEEVERQLVEAQAVIVEDHVDPLYRDAAFSATMPSREEYTRVSRRAIDQHEARTTGAKP